MQCIKILARTFELNSKNDNLSDNNWLIESTVLSGRAAGVCYMPDSYQDIVDQGEERAINRAKSNVASGHHSVFDHSHVTLLINTNKAMAMILNSLGVYATSEKSARYTRMTPETELEMQMYEKWKTKIQNAILGIYPDTDDNVLEARLSKVIGKDVKIVNRDSTIELSEVEQDKFESIKLSDTLPSYKLAQENARYMLSVFTPTTMVYTVSYRQIFLIIDYLKKLELNCKALDEGSFGKKLHTYVEELYKDFELLVKDAPVQIKDNKNQYIRFLEAQHTSELDNSTKEIIKFNDMEKRLKSKKECYGDAYTAIYYGSLAMLAQEQRHRTIRYTMCLEEAGEYNFYVPKIVSASKLEDEWLRDINSVAYCVPQGTIVRITEQGIFEDFVLKCKERMCGRAQLETMEQTKKTVEKFVDNIESLSYCNAELLKGITKSNTDSNKNKACARCEFKDFKCSEGCRWGAKEALIRLI